jgi:hypothetical protein
MRTAADPLPGDLPNAFIKFRADGGHQFAPSRVSNRAMTIAGGTS